MRMKLMTLALAGALAFGGAGTAMAGPGNNNGNGPDATGPAKDGLCTAYFNGQKNGHGKNGNNPPPFQNLEDAADQSDFGDGDGVGTPNEVFDFCGGPDGIGGNPDENGRFTTCWTDDDGDPETHPCND